MWRLGGYSEAGACCNPDTARQAAVDASARFQAAVTAYATAEDESRVEVEMRAKLAVRHAEAS